MYRFLITDQIYVLTYKEPFVLFVLAPYVYLYSLDFSKLACSWLGSYKVGKCFGGVWRTVPWSFNYWNNFWLTYQNMGLYISMLMAFGQIGQALCVNYYAMMDNGPFMVLAFWSYKDERIVGRLICHLYDCFTSAFMEPSCLGQFVTWIGMEILFLLFGWDLDTQRLCGRIAFVIGYGLRRCYVAMLLSMFFLCC
ncbi:hypothetical protein L6452_27591 [Arctium lappa]|uniref:Uncharacterized protein n=1 Tax=Arctium lappa TaxID=4217 RepID=A0ACB8ZVK1_ARCLA|nr:hypothetical protein L6452_27591 [Arctium lappa]